MCKEYNISYKNYKTLNAEGRLSGKSNWLRYPFSVLVQGLPKAVRVKYERDIIQLINDIELRGRS